MNRRQNEVQTHHRQENKFGFVIRNTGTGAYICDMQLRRHIFQHSRRLKMNLNDLISAANHMKRSCLSGLR